mmetsp:Transcript_59378/g.134415  ORF Transcript_59378/g.134415 Transcript_59378/m.134415 type:complete len:153 (+) Transcript_59378:233-691(+)
MQYDSFLSTPSIVVPPHIVTSDDTLKLLRGIIPEDHPKIKKFEQIVQNTQVEKRHLARPLNETVNVTGLAARQQVYERVAPSLAFEAAELSMAEANARPEDISAVIAVSATAPANMMPGLDQMLISQLKLAPSTLGYPVAQWGCRGGGASLK